MEKKRIAVLFGGNSSEYEVSLQSASSVLENINREKFVKFVAIFLAAIMILSTGTALLQIFM